MVLPPRLYAIADGDHLGLAAVVSAVAELAEAGFSWIQLRLKTGGDGERFRIAEQCTRRLEGSAVCLWIDDRVDLAMFLPCFFGVHLGQRDLPPARAREILGAGCVIGLSTHNEAQCQAADGDAAVDVVAVGPIFPTSSKVNPDPPLHLSGLRRLRGLTSKPLVAIGGIDETRVASVLDQGADSAVVLSALGSAQNVGQNARKLLRLVA